MVLVPQIDRWLDLDLDNESRRIQRLTGANPRRSSLGAERPILEDKFAEEVIPYEKLAEIIAQKDADGSWMSELITEIKDQDGEGACVTDAIAACHQICQCKEVGPSRVVFVSAMSIYRWIANSAQSGSNLDDALEQMNRVGILPVDNEANKAKFKHTHPNVGWNVKFASGWEETAGTLKGLEQLDIRGPEGFWTAVGKGWPVMFARDGHCIMCPKLIWKPEKKLVIPYLNSWGKWGDAVNAQFNYGMGYDSESKMRNYASGSIAFRQVMVAGAA